ncbi:hypothetical protein [Sediminitomix flava]|uniref:GLPGLI family protein n=1 Tax=Sediminitomix flava TaxID=379075 RepID=A0A315Z734_SEDFL|nr:hypothetical protein [Sediminitomix flava]PWJ39215.1 hypothetical protein BC781_106116 [Sediminitomix flava]
MKKLNLVLILVALPIITFAQSGRVQDMVDPFNTNTSLIYGKGNEKINGSPFLYEYWSRLEVLTKKDKMITFDKGKLDVCSQKILFEKDGKEQWLQDNHVKQVSLLNADGSKEVYYRAALDGETVYLRHLVEGNQSLFVHYQINIVKPKQNFEQGYGSSSSTKKAYFSKIKTNYLVSADGLSFKLLKTKKKQAHEAFPAQYHSEIKSLIKKEKLSLKNESDVISLVEKINGIIQQ